MGQPIVYTLKEISMKKSIALAVLALATMSSVFAACPAGTRYDCVTTMNGKQSCGCR